MQPQIAAQLETADALGGVDEQAESHQQRPYRQLSVRERRPAGRRELSVAGLAFEQAATPISIDGRAAAVLHGSRERHSDPVIVVSYAMRTDSGRPSFNMRFN